MNNYIENQKEISKEQIASYVINDLKERIASDWYKGKKTLYKNLLELAEKEDHYFKSFVNGLFELNDALIKGRSVFALCEKQPRNLDSGKHYYSIYYTTNECKVTNFWPYTFAPLVGMDEQNRDRSLRKWVFSSGAIGMSRVLDATDSLFNYIKKIGGCYCQVDVI